jgi:carbon storage regulator
VQTNRVEVVLYTCNQGRGVKMLILTRRIGEKLIVGGNVTVTVLSIKGNQIRLGIDAPREIKVHREEIYQKIQAEQAEKKASALNDRKAFILNDRKTSVLNDRKFSASKDRETLALKARRKITGKEHSVAVQNNIKIQRFI